MLVIPKAVPVSWVEHAIDKYIDLLNMKGAPSVSEYLSLCPGMEGMKPYLEKCIMFKAISKDKIPSVKPKR